MNAKNPTDPFEKETLPAKMAIGLTVEKQLRGLFFFKDDEYEDHIRREAHIALARVLKGYSFGMIPEKSEADALALTNVQDIIYGLWVLNRRYADAHIIFSFEDEILSADYSYPGKAGG